MSALRVEFFFPRDYDCDAETVILDVSVAPAA
jgi:hypothetical protein